MNGERKISIGNGRKLLATPVFDTYWRFACARQSIFHARVAGQSPPWSRDEVLSRHRFTNAYRASDRVSQYLIRNVQYTGSQDHEELFFRTVLFKIFNKVETWEHLVNKLGPLKWKTFDRKAYALELDRLKARQSIYSGAYIMPSPAFGSRRKHRNHLQLLEKMMLGGAPERTFNARGLSGMYDELLQWPSLGEFLAFQFAIDLNYTSATKFSEMEFVVAGPGAKNGLRKCFRDTGGLNDADTIRAVADLAEAEFERLGLAFNDLWGRPLQLIDCQNLFCEVDKYSRVVHPEYTAEGGRSRIKQRYNPTHRPTPQWYPPKWQLQPAVARHSDAA